MSRSQSRSIGVAGLVLSLAVGACNSTHRAEVRTAPQPAAGPIAASVRADSIRHPYTLADVDFMSHMIGHHAQALIMAGWAPSHGASSAIQVLAGRIINGQQDEIATMQRWLGDRGKPVPEARPTGMKMPMNGMDHVMLMPGMLTDAQMKELDQARGPEFDRLFLTDMIQHHKGAVFMVKELFGTNGAAQDETVFKFANDVNVDQSTEIARMQRMLDGFQSAKGAP
ncbi:MAG: DUF305 domain-containing protein [Gemmatimonadales bacterium]